MCAPSLPRAEAGGAQREVSGWKVLMMSKRPPSPSTKAQAAPARGGRVQGGGFRTCCSSVGPRGTDFKVPTAVASRRVAEGRAGALDTAWPRLRGPLGVTRRTQCKETGNRNCVVCGFVPLSSGRQGARQREARVGVLASGQTPSCPRSQLVIVSPEPFPDLLGLQGCSTLTPSSSVISVMNSFFPPKSPLDSVSFSSTSCATQARARHIVLNE